MKKQKYKINEDNEMWRAIDEEKRQRHAEWKISNHAVIKKARIPYRWAGEETMILRVPGKPNADFYPSTGRWRSGGKTYSGGAAKFLDWYSNQSGSTRLKEVVDKILEW
jgi:hypothetical protein